ncbi:hypothetical protein GCM10009830_31930 [Glycomyces endophyticus]|uniref:Uncharacterized protein n=1 Tax=Glycomyces endophyticus TaxID=480996 RepID=A0ABP4T4V4_9ACTN
MPERGAPTVAQDVRVVPDAAAVSRDLSGTRARPEAPAERTKTANRALPNVRDLRRSVAVRFV